MRVLITGAFGYIGLAVTQRLAREHDVVAVGRRPRKKCEQEVLAAIPGNVEYKEIDTIEMPYQHVDAVVHLAGGGASGGDMADPRAALTDNVLSAVHVAESVPPKARKILASSIYVYGVSERPWSEADRCHPDTLYGAQKLIAESVWQQEGGTALRFSHVYGVGSGVDFGRDGVTERLARSVTGGDYFHRHGTGEQRIDLVHIDDACEAIVLALDTDSLPPAINIGGGRTESINELIHLFDPGRFLGSLEAEPADRQLHIACAGVRLGWKPRVALTDGVTGLITMYNKKAA